MEIMKLIPTGKDYLWGGIRLRKEYGKKIDLSPLAETWECSVHPDGPSYIANGSFKGWTLAEVLKTYPKYLGTKVDNGELPVLVKFIDAKKDLSVQVHPNDEYAKEYEGDNGKTEMWYVIDADEGAHLIYGFQHEVTEEILRKAVETGTLDKHLQKVPVHKGDTYFVPSGMVFLTPIAYGTGIKTKILEAMAMKMPVVTNSIGAEGIHARNNEHWYVSDNYDELARKIDELLLNEDLRKKMGENSQKFVKDFFQWDIVFEQFKKLNL